VRSDCARALCCVALATALTGCAMAGKTGPPSAAYEPAYREGTPPKKNAVPEPRSIAAWETRVQSHAAMLASLVHSGGGGATTAPAGPPSPGPRARPPRAQPHRARPNRAQSTYPSPPPPGTTAVSRRSIRCRRICRHVRAICYAAKRICQIAARVGGDSARAACERNRKRCRSAQAAGAQYGCTLCGRDALR